MDALASMTLGERLALVRRRRKLKQKDLARRIGVAASEIHRLEQGLVRDPRSSRIVALAAAMEVTTDLLLRGIGALPPAGELAGAAPARGPAAPRLGASGEQTTEAERGTHRDQR